jgi:hypothetical protein
MSDVESRRARGGRRLTSARVGKRVVVPHHPDELERAAGRSRSREFIMYIGIGAVLVILLILILVGVLR